MSKKAVMTTNTGNIIDLSSIVPLSINTITHAFIKSIFSALLASPVPNAFLKVKVLFAKK